jgi:hypothetical protein
MLPFGGCSQAMTSTCNSLTRDLPAAAMSNPVPALFESVKALYQRALLPFFEELETFSLLLLILYRPCSHCPYLPNVLTPLYSFGLD